MTSTAPLKAPFPWFGGKRRVAHLVWERFGHVANYVEPFAGSLAVLLARPTEARTETVNDLDCFIANFWRALAGDPEGVARHADWPVNEADLHARHKWLHNQVAWRERMHKDAEFFDARIAGWWVWGISCWIGDNWCRTGEQSSRPHLHASKGVHRNAENKRPVADGKNQGRGVHRVGISDGTGLDMRRPALTSANGVHAKMPDVLGRGAKGTHQAALAGAQAKRPLLSGNGHGVGIHAHRALSAQTPDLHGDSGATGRGVHACALEKKTGGLQEYFELLAARLRRVRVCCGDWSRVLGPSVTTAHGVTGIFFDPPYGVEDRDKVYNADSLDVAADVTKWCAENGPQERLRIALCGYEGEHNRLEALGWIKLAWKAAGGYGARNKANQNAKRERIWFSPHCLQADLFGNERAE